MKPQAPAAAADLEALTNALLEQEAALREGGGQAGRKRQASLGRLTVRERLARLLDDAGAFFELNLWAGWRMYEAWGQVPAAGIVTGIGPIHNRPCMIIANDATVKAGAFFPQTVKKVLRAQRIAHRCNLPLVYLVDSSGVFLPLQDEIFPDEDDFGRIFRNNAVLSAAGVPQFAAIMGNCVAGGAYLPVLCDKVLMTEGSALYLAGPSLVKAAIGQDVDEEELGGALMHAQISGTIDYHEPNDKACLDRLRELIKLLPQRFIETDDTGKQAGPQRDPKEVYQVLHAPGQQYDMHEVLGCIIDSGSFQEYKASYGRSLITAYASVGGHAVGIIANQHASVRSKTQGVQLPGVIYADSADKAARFVMDCDHTGLPIIFLQDVVGFMVGKDAEHSGIIRHGAKLVNVVANARVPKLTVILGGSFGAGNYALCGKAFDPHLVFAWPGARYAVMGAAQAAGTLLMLEQRQHERGGKRTDEQDREQLRQQIHQRYEQQTDIRYGAARGWVDAIIAPHTTRDVLIRALRWVKRPPPPGGFRAGVLQV